ncbi:hypothetical protein SynA1544_02774 [Synechococcus sp. A15-44]|nr:hypothetical protein SynA1544_02774 [Synechococcus sp. A15-44]
MPLTWVFIRYGQTSSWLRQRLQLIKPELIRLCDLCSQQKKDGVTVFI